MPHASYCHRHGPRQGTGPCPDCARETDQRRGTRQQRGLDDHWLALVQQAIALRPYCAYCGATTDLTGDHRIPRSKGGVARTIDDVIVACRSCNSSRGDRDDEGGMGSVVEHAGEPLATQISVRPQISGRLATIDL